MKLVTQFFAIMLSIIFSINVALAEVKIQHKPIKKANSGQRIELDAKITDDKQIQEVRAYWKTADDIRFWFVPMHGSGKKFKGVLPAFALGAKSVDYRIYAVNEASEFVKTQLFTIVINDDEEALARLEAKEPTNIEIDATEFEEIRDLARSGGEPDPNQRVDVRNDVPGSSSPANIPGVQDYIVMSNAAPAAAGAGLAGAATVSASAGAGAGTVAVGIGLAAAGAAAAYDEISDDEDEGESTGGGGTSGSGGTAGSSFAGSYSGTYEGSCANGFTYSGGTISITINNNNSYNGTISGQLNSAFSGNVSNAGNLTPFNVADCTFRGSVSSGSGPGGNLSCTGAGGCTGIWNTN